MIDYLSLLVSAQKIQVYLEKCAEFSLRGLERNIRFLEKHSFPIK